MLAIAAPGEAASREVRAAASSVPNTSGSLVSYSLPWPETSPLTFLKHAASAPRIYWENERASLSLAGYGLAATVTASGPERFRVVRQQAARLFEGAVSEAEAAPPEVGPRLFGGFAFWPEARPAGIWAAFPAAYFVLPHFQLTCLAGQSWLTVNHCLAEGDDPEQILESLRGDVGTLRLALELAGEPAKPPRLLPFRPEVALDVSYPMDRSAWRKLITSTTGRIRRGELDKVVMARTCWVKSTRMTGPVEVLTELKHKYPDCYRFLIEPLDGHIFYGATPELLARVDGNSLETVALAGSIGRGSTQVEDEELGRRLLASPKERQEHAFVVEALRAGLEPLVRELVVPAQPGLYRLHNIQHLMTPVRGRLAEPGAVLPVIEALHPTPAMGGSPRQVALGLIAAEEPLARGWYAAPVGWFDPDGNGLFAVAIRSAVSVGHEACLFAGAGIVADSDPEREWQETDLKFRPMLEALGDDGTQSKCSMG